MNVIVVGAGYVGLVTAACFAARGIKVILVERDIDKLTLLRTGKSPFFEPQLDDLIVNGLSCGLLLLASSLSEVLSDQPVIVFICVGTPFDDAGQVDLSAVYAVAQDIGKNMRQYCLVVDKSTVPVGTSLQVTRLIGQGLHSRGIQVDVDVVSNPEFLREGSAVHDTMHPDRIVVGGTSSYALDILRNLYQPFIVHDNQFLVMDPASAELTKYAANAMLALRISFMNQLARLAEQAGADIAYVRSGIGKDLRIGNDFLQAGIGYGGSCLPKDIKGLIYMGEQYNVPMTIAKKIDQVNNEQKVWFTQKIIQHYGVLTGKRVGIWGLSFKPNTDDIRCAPSLDIIRLLLDHGVVIVAYDPVASERVRAVIGDAIQYVATADEVLNTSDCLVLITEWKEFYAYQPHNFLKLADKTVFDGRNCFNSADMAAAGAIYYAIGRPVIRPVHHNRSLQHDRSLLG